MCYISPGRYFTKIGGTPESGGVNSEAPSSTFQYLYGGNQRDYKEKITEGLLTGLCVGDSPQTFIVMF